MTSSAISHEGSLDEGDSHLTRLRRQGPEAHTRAQSLTGSPHGDGIACVTDERYAPVVST
jgi:hypothetical protein